MSPGSIVNKPIQELPVPVLVPVVVVAGCPKDNELCNTATAVHTIVPSRECARYWAARLLSAPH